MKNHTPTPKHVGKHFAWQRKMVKVRNAVRPKRKQSSTQEPPTLTKANQDYVIEDLATHGVKTMEYDYYMDSYN